MREKHLREGDELAERVTAIPRRAANGLAGAGAEVQRRLPARLASSSDARRDPARARVLGVPATRLTKRTGERFIRRGV